MNARYADFARGLIPIDVTFPTQPLMLVGVISCIVHALSKGVSLVPFIDQREENYAPSTSPRIVSSVPAVHGRAVVYRTVRPRVVAFSIRSLVRNNRHLFVIFYQLRVAIHHGGAFQFRVGVAIAATYRAGNGDRHPVRRQFLVCFRGTLFVDLSWGVVFAPGFAVFGKKGSLVLSLFPSKSEP